MVSNHDVARVEALVRMHCFDQACRDLDPQSMEFAGQRADHGVWGAVERKKQLGFCH
jgi:hypothetical protein